MAANLNEITITFGTDGKDFCLSMAKVAEVDPFGDGNIQRNTKRLIAHVEPGSPIYDALTQVCEAAAAIVESDHSLTDIIANSKAAYEAQFDRLGGKV